MATKLAALPLSQSGIILFDPPDNPSEVPIGGRLNDLKVLRQKAAVPFASLTDSPDDSELVCTPADGLLDVGITDVDRVDVGLTVDDHRGKPHGKGNAGNQEILRHPVGGDHL